MKLLIAGAVGLAVALILGQFFGLIGWLMGIVVAFALGTFLSAQG